MTLPLPITNPFDLNLSSRFLVSQGLSPLIAGDDWTLRLQYKFNGLAQSLTGALILMHVRRELDDDEEAALFTRRSDTNIPSTVVKQVEADADQVVENVPLATGKGWFTIRCSDEDEATLRAAVGWWHYDVRVKLAGGDVKTVAKGMIEILDPATRPTT